jgi:drug/metabolite transporter (DMT)-like permease
MVAWAGVSKRSRKGAVRGASGGDTVPVRHATSDWGLLLALTVLWGSAFLFTKIAVTAIPFELVVAGRLGIAALLLVPLAAVLGRRLPRGGRLWLFLVLIALFGNALPFSLISWGQRFIDSGLAGILMAVMPLATLSLSHFLVPGERLTARRLGGFLLGFSGVVVLMGPAALLKLGDGGGDLLAMLAVLGGAVCYGISLILARLRPPSDTISSAAATIAVAALMMAPFALGSARTEPLGADAAPAILSVLVLGVLSTALAALLYFRLIRSAGPAFVSQLNYLIPLWAVLIGVLFLGELPQLKHLLALALILGGVLLAQLDRRSLGRA